MNKLIERGQWRDLQPEEQAGTEGEREPEAELGLVEKVGTGEASCWDRMREFKPEETPEARG